MMGDMYGVHGIDAEMKIARMRDLILRLSKPDPINYDYMECWYCEQEYRTIDFDGGLDLVLAHTEDCPWMEAVAQHGAPTDPECQYRHVSVSTEPDLKTTSAPRPKPGGAA